MQSIQSGVGGGSSRQNLSFVFDALGNLTSRSDANAGLTESFVYDNLYRLTSASVNGGAATTVSYAANGNITSKSDVGAYTYGTRLHAVATVGGNSYSYDANGNLTSKNGAGISWYADNKLQSITGSGISTALEYTPSGAYWKQFAVYLTNPNGNEVTTYIGGLLEIVTKGGVTNFRHHINAAGRTVAIVNRTGATTSTSYLLVDHLGSVETVTDSSGNVVVKESFDPWGKRRNPSTWSGSISGTDEANIANTTRRGFTGHTELDNFGLVHMNGRVYDPGIGRFLSADPFIQFPDVTQSWNRYSYVLNNPLSYTDPSGYFSFRSLWRNIKAFIPEIARWALNSWIPGLGDVLYNAYTLTTAIRSRNWLAAAMSIYGVKQGFNNISAARAGFGSLNAGLANTGLCFGGGCGGAGGGAMCFVECPGGGMGNMGTWGNRILHAADDATDEGGLQEVLVTAQLRWARLRALLDSAKALYRRLDIVAAHCRAIHCITGMPPMGAVAGRVAGVATIFQDGRHVSIAVRSGDQVLHTEQLVETGTKATTIAEVEGGAAGTQVFSMELSNANAAMEYQRSVIGTATGTYNGLSNSCVTHCADVLRAGGVSDVPSTTSSIIRWIREMGGG